MALLKGTNPECEATWVPMVRWNVKRVRRGLFRRDRIEVSVERLAPTWKGDVWITLDPVRGEWPTEAEQETLLALTMRDSASEVVLAKLAHLVRVNPQSVAFVVDSLRGRLDQARKDRDRFAETIGEMNRIQELMVVSSKRIEQERDWETKKSARLLEVKSKSIAELEGLLNDANACLKEFADKGYRATSIRADDGETIERGDNVFLGTDPERRLLLIDCAEAICAENLRVVGLPEGVPVFAKRDNARAWKRSQRNPISSPVGSGAPAVPAMPTASPNGNGDGADTAAGEADLLDFIGVRP